MRWILIIPFLFLACSSNDEEEDCKPMPTSYTCIKNSSEVFNTLKIRITTNTLNPKVPIYIFRGSNVETGTLVLKDTIDRATTYQLTDGNYAAYAVYDVIYEGDSAKVIKPNDVRLSSRKEEYCEDDCYEGDFEDIDLKLLSKLR